MEKERIKFIVKEKESIFREDIIEFLEARGYILDKNEPRSRQEIIDYFLPIIIYPAEKTFAMIGNVTCAAAVSSTGRLSTRQEFFADFGQSKPEYEEYKRQICKHLVESSWHYSKKRAKEIITENEHFVIVAFEQGEDAEDIAIDIGYGCG